MANKGVRIDFEANLTKFSSGVEQMNGQLSKLESQAFKVGAGIRQAFIFGGAALASAGLGTLAKGAIDSLNRLDDLSKSSGISASKLAGLGIAAKGSGSDLESVTSIITNLTQRIGKNGEQFRKLGVTARDPLEAFKQMADISNAISDPMQRNAVLTKAFGASWKDAAPLLAEGSAGIARLVEEGTKASGVTDEAAAEAARFNSELDGMKAKIGGVAVSIVSEFLPEMSKLVDMTANAGKEIRYAFGFVNEDIKIGDRLREIGELTSSALKVQRLFNLIGAEPPEGGSNSYINKLNEEALTLKKRLEEIRTTQERGAATAKPPAESDIKNFLGGNGKTDAEKAYDALLKKQKSFIDSLQKEASTLGMTSVQQKLYEAGILKITGAQLSGVKTNAERIENYKQEQDVLEAMRNSYADAADSYLKFIQATQADVKSATDKVDRLKVELGLMDKTEAARTKALSLYDLEIKYEERLKELRGQNISDNIFNIEKESLEKAKSHEQEVIRLQEFLDTQKKAAAETQKIWDNFGFNFQRNIGDQIYNGLNGNFKDISSAWKSMLTRMLADAAAAQLSSALFGKDGSGGMLGAGMKIFSSLLGLGSLGAGGGAGSGQLRVSTGGLTGFAANGAYFDGNVAKFALGGIVNSPTPFKFADGGSFRSGLMGEAGPEAIMPLTRDSKGRLGVSGGGGGVVINDNRSIHIDSRSDRASIMQDIQRANKQSNAELVDLLSRQGKI